MAAPSRRNVYAGREIPRDVKRTLDRIGKLLASPAYRVRLAERTQVGTAYDLTLQVIDADGRDAAGLFHLIVSFSSTGAAPTVTFLTGDGYEIEGGGAYAACTESSGSIQVRVDATSGVEVAVRGTVAGPAEEAATLTWS